MYTCILKSTKKYYVFTDVFCVSELDKVVEVEKGEGEAGYGFHLSGGAPVVISTVEPGTTVTPSLHLSTFTHCHYVSGHTEHLGTLTDHVVCDMCYNAV